MGLRTIWWWWLNGVLLPLRLAAVLLTLCSRVCGRSSASPSLVLHRLARRLRLSTLLCSLPTGLDMTSIACLGAVDAIDSRPQHPAAAALHRQGANAASNASPADGPPSPTSAPVHPPPAMASHARSKTMSHSNVGVQSKRLSLQFPIQPTAAASATPAARPRSRPQSWVNGQTAAPASDPSPAPEPSILSVLAAQERYVLELRDELNKAEVDLTTLKRYFQQQEGSKAVGSRRTHARQSSHLPHGNTLPAKDGAGSLDEEGVSLQREMERRKALLTSLKKSERKTIPGSRHLRTLSLLSPDRQFPPTFPQPLDTQDAESAEKLGPAPSRSSTSSERSRPHSYGLEERYELGGIQSIQRETIIRAGTQMANDFKTGLFTFIEDLRQATVGDEAVHEAEGHRSPPHARRSSVKHARKPSDARPPLNRAPSAKKPAGRPASVGDDFWKEMGLSDAKTAVGSKKPSTLTNGHTPQRQASKPVEEEDWDNWDTPNEATVGKLIDLDSSSDESEGHTSQLSGQASSRTSTQSIQYHTTRHDSQASISPGPIDDAIPRAAKRNSTSWHDLVKLSPNHLKRTASHLMKEWEKQLTPPAESRTSSFTHGDYLGRSGSPTGLP